MTLNNINVEETVQQVANLLATEQGLSPALKGSLEMLLLLVSLLQQFPISRYALFLGGMRNRLS